MIEACCSLRSKSFVVFSCFLDKTADELLDLGTLRPDLVRKYSDSGIRTCAIQVFKTRDDGTDDCQMSYGVLVIVCSSSRIPQRVNYLSTGVDHS